MKKYVKLVVAAAVLLCGMVFMGCKNLREAFAGPQDEWFMRQVTYTRSDKEATLNVFVRYSEEDFTTENDVPIGAGLTVVVTAYTDANDILSDLAGDKYIMKTFSNTEPTTITATDDDSNKDSVSLTMSTTKWDIMWNLVDMESYGNRIPPFDKTQHYQIVNSIENFSWKEILADYLIDSILN